MTRKGRLAAYAAVGALTIAAGSAEAATLLYSFSSSVNPSRSFSFTVENQPRPISFTLGNNFVAEVGNAAGIAGNTITFFSSGVFGGLTRYVGPQLYSGSEANPSLMTGSFVLGDIDNPAVGTLSVTQIASAIPEPTVWTMMLVGFGMIGAIARYRRRATKIAYA